jgi:predicted HTH transcriptional regulator
MEKLENQIVEFKQSWHDEYLKTVAAFANSKGGTV